jgi:transcriptional regulator with XRE-family HTH domain
MSKKSGGPTRTRPLKKLARRDRALNGTGDALRVRGGASVVGGRKAAGSLPLPDGRSRDVAGASDDRPRGKVNRLVKGVRRGHAVDFITHGSVSSITRSYEAVGNTRGMHSPTSNFWSRLLEAMADKGLPTKQVSVAKLGGVSQPAARKWAEGGLPDVDRIREIANKLDVSIDWLLTGEGQKRPHRDATSDPSLERLLAIWPDMDADARQQLAELAQHLPRTKKKL